MCKNKLWIWICCKMQIISSSHLCSDLVTAFIHYFPTLKLLMLSSTTLELALICLTAVINCTNSHLSTDVSFATAIDMFCSVGHICYLIWFDVSFFIHIIGWRLSVSINDMLCYVMLFWRQLLNVSSQWWHRRTNCWNKSNFMKIDWYITELLKIKRTTFVWNTM